MKVDGDLSVVRAPEVVAPPTLPRLTSPDGKSGKPDVGRLLIVSNRLPITLAIKNGRVRIRRSSGGLASALRAVRRERHASWIGWLGTEVAPESRVDLGPMLRNQNIIPVTLREDDQRVFYDSLANGVLWPALHSLLDHIPAAPRAWTVYESVNAQFAAATVNAYRPGDIIWVHDYQLCRVPQLVRKRLPSAPIGFFLHTPFPSPDVFAALPARRELITGLLNADLIGFQTSSCLQHFAEAARALVHADVDVGVNGVTVTFDSRRIRLGVFPISVDPGSFEREAARRDVILMALGLRESPRRLMVGVDRLDYTKGLLQRLHAFERLLRRHPRWRERVQLIQIAVPSRQRTPAYRRLRTEVEKLVGRINGAFSTTTWTPVVYLHRSIPGRVLAALYRAADVMVVTPLRDGMNLVAKEFVASRVDGDGVLLLSEFAGAARELTDAVIVNPYDVEQMIALMETSLTMPRAERRTRMARLRHQVRTHDVHAWAEGFLSALAKATVGRPASSALKEPEKKGFSALPAA